MKNLISIGSGCSDCAALLRDALFLACFSASESVAAFNFVRDFYVGNFSHCHIRCSRDLKEPCSDARVVLGLGHRYSVAAVGGILGPSVNKPTFRPYCFSIPAFYKVSRTQRKVILNNLLD